MEFLRFTFSSFWTFIGVLILLSLILEGISAILSIRNKRLEAKIAKLTKWHAVRITGVVNTDARVFVCSMTKQTETFYNLSDAIEFFKQQTEGKWVILKAES